VSAGTHAPNGRDPVQQEAHFRYVLRLGDTSLVLGQRLGEWVGHAPALEEDLGLANLALDLIGQAVHRAVADIRSTVKHATSQIG